MTDDLDAETLAFAHRMFDLARDPDHGSRSAMETARFFHLPEMLTALYRS